MAILNPGTHADDAMVNLNFWVVDDDANLGTGGGMTVYLTEPPQDANVGPARLSASYCQLWPVRF